MCIYIGSRKKESRAWIQALPMSSLCLGMDDKVIRVAIGLWWVFLSIILASVIGVGLM